MKKGKKGKTCRRVKGYTRKGHRVSGYTRCK